MGALGANRWAGVKTVGFVLLALALGAGVWDCGRVAAHRRVIPASGLMGMLLASFLWRTSMN